MSFLQDISNQNNNEQPTNEIPAQDFDQDPSNINVMPEPQDEQPLPYENKSEDEALLRREKMHLIDCYKRRFPEKLARLRTDDLDTLNLEQLELRLKECKADLSVGGMNKMFNNAVMSGIFLTEYHL